MHYVLAVGFFALTAYICIIRSSVDSEQLPLLGNAEYNQYLAEQTQLKNKCDYWLAHNVQLEECN